MLRPIIRALAICGLVAASSQAMAVETPHSGVLDSRYRSVEYRPEQVYRLTVNYGYTLLIQFDEGESVEDGAVAMGDPGAWQVGPKGRNLLIKPTAKDAATNMTVITNKRTYAFDLHTNSSSSPSMYVVKFTYPQERARERAAAQAKQNRVNEVASRLPNKYEGVNWAYYAKGSTTIWPARVYDNGQFTYITFAPQQPMPSVYEVTPSGDERIINSHVEGNTLVLHRVVEHFVMRHGGDVTCVINKAFDPNGRNNESRSSAPGLERVVK